MKLTLLCPSRLALFLAMGMAALPALRAQPPSFEVVSVKPNNSGSGRSSESTGPGLLTATNITINSLIQQAFGVRAFQISGGPGWLTSENYDIAAKTGTSKDLSELELRPYIQALLADRFRFRYHRETKEMQVYSLVVARGGAKLPVDSGEGDATTNVTNGAGKSTVQSTRSSMAHLASLLGARLDRVVNDNTGLTEKYRIQLEWAPNPAPESAEPSLFTALQEQLGLRLEATKGPVEIIVIDGVEKPSEN